MNILAITQHTQLLERLRTAFEGAGHRVTAVPDHLHALAGESWNDAHLILVDAVGDPMDGYRLCNLLRAESRALFRNLPIFLILEHPPEAEDQAQLVAADGDGFIEADGSIQRLLKVIGPLLEGTTARSGGSRMPLLACGLAPAQARRIGEVVKHYGFELHVCTRKELPGALAQWRPSVLFQGLGRSGDRALATLRSLADLPQSPYPVLVGNIVGEAEQRKLLTAGTMDWLTVPLSAPMVLHVVRRAMEWLHAKRVQRECQQQINDLVERRVLLEMETSALRNEVLTDPLTELLNRRAFNQNLDHALNQWERHKRAFVLILGDLDYFKLINDRFGHLVGDQVLKAVAQRIRSGLRRSDLAFRIGGEEFAILLSETSLQAGLEVADKIRRRIDETPVTLDSGQNVFPTMSFGIGGPDAEDTASLFVRVDQALYAAKHKGRNRVELMGNVGV
jgi:diguanylate cyclase (GGDEF)-like protein